MAQPKGSRKLALRPQYPEGYLDGEQAAEFAKVDEKTIRNWRDAGQIGKLDWKGLVLFRKSDIESKLAERAEVVISQNPAGVPMVASIGAQMAAAIRAQQPEPGPQSPTTMFVTVEEASDRTRLNERFLKQIAAEGKIEILRSAGPHGADMIRWADLVRLAGITKDSQ